MAAKKFPIEWPVFGVRESQDLKTFYRSVRDALKSIDDLRKKLTEVGNDHADRLTAQTGSGAPSSTPTDTLLFYLDTVAKDMYVSVGTSSSADWKKITP